MSQTIPPAPCICMRLLVNELSDKHLHEKFLQMKIIALHYKQDMKFSDINFDELLEMLAMFEDVLQVCKFGTRS